MDVGLFGFMGFMLVVFVEAPLDDTAIALSGLVVTTATILHWPSAHVAHGDLLAAENLGGLFRTRKHIPLAEISAIVIEAPRGPSDRHARFPLSAFIEVEWESHTVRTRLPPGPPGVRVLDAILMGTRTSSRGPPAAAVLGDPRTHP
jgi:hypothetical protein